jgi:hypothetical protein
MTGGNGPCGGECSRISFSFSNLFFFFRRQKPGCACVWDGPGHTCDFCKQRKITYNLSGRVKRWRVILEDGLEVETPRKKVWTEVLGVRRPSVFIEMTPVERLLWELLASNSRVMQAVEEKVEVLCNLTKEVRGLGAIWSEYLGWNGMEEQEGRNRSGEDRKKTETEKETETELHTEDRNGAEVVEEMEKEERKEGKGMEKETEAEAEVIVVEGGSEDGVGEETMDAE